jgi:hypothetical protein
MQTSNQTTSLRRSSRIEKLDARKKAEHAQQIAILEAEAKAAEKQKRKKPIQKRRSPQAKSGTKTPVGGKRKGGQSTDSTRSNKKPKTGSEQVEGDAEFDAGITDEHQDVITSPDVTQPPVDEGQEFLQVVLNVIWTLGSLCHKRTARRKCLSEQAELDELIKFHRPALLSTPDENTNNQARDELKAEMAKFERNLEERHKKEEDLDKDINTLKNGILDVLVRRMDEFMITETLLDRLPPSMRENPDIRESLRYCRELLHTIKGVEHRLQGAKRELKATLDRHSSDEVQLILGEPPLKEKPP